MNTQIKEYSNSGKDPATGRKYHYVNIANPIKLGMSLGIGFLIVLPLMLIVIAFALMTFVATVGNLF